MISALELRQQMAFALDAEGSDHYRDDSDFIPAINASIKWLTSVVNSAFGQNKIGEEFFRDIAYSGVFQTDEDSRVSLKVFPNEVWSVLGIYINPTTKRNKSTPFPVMSDLSFSYHRRDLIFLESGLDCKRLTIEEWARNKSNPFEPGYDGDQLCESLKRYSYLNPFNHWNSNTNPIHSEEIEVRPKLKNKLIAVFWVKKPTVISSISDNIEFPSSCFQLLFDKALNYISMKQGDQTSIYSITERDINQLLNLM